MKRNRIRRIRIKRIFLSVLGSIASGMFFAVGCIVVERGEEMITHQDQPSKIPTKIAAEKASPGTRTIQRVTIKLW